MKKLFTSVSIVCFIFAFFMFWYLFLNVSIPFIDRLYSISIFIPVIISTLGGFSAFFGLKGFLQKILLVMHVSLIILLCFFIFIAMFGFQEP